MKNYIITIARGFGSGGKMIGNMLSEELGIPCYERQILEMASEYSDYTSLITKWEEKLKDKEDYYYKKFSAMETALAKLNSQTSSLTGLFGN